MPYSIRTKDGIVINNIPDDVPRDSEELKRRVQSERIKRDNPDVMVSSPKAGIMQGERNASLFDEAAAAVATPVAIGAGMADQAVAGLRGLAASVNPLESEGAGARAVEQSLANPFYSPESELVKRNLQSIGQGVESVLGEEGLDILGTGKEMGQQALERTGSPLLATTYEILPELLSTVTGMSAYRAAQGNLVLKDATGRPTPLLQRMLDEKGVSYSSLPPKIQNSIPAEVPRTMSGKPSGVDPSEIAAKTIEAGGKQGGLAPYTVTNTGKLTTDDLAKQALNQKWGMGTVQMAKTATPETKELMLDMMDKYRNIAEENVSARARPTDVTGLELQKRVSYLGQKMKDAREDLDLIAKNSLRGKPVDATRVADMFFRGLDDLRVTWNAADQKYDFKGSIIQEDAGSKALLNKATRLMQSAAEKGDAEALHLLKRQLDAMANYEKLSKGGLSDAGRNFIKGIRAEVNNTLRDLDPEYARVNDIMSEGLSVFDDLNRASATHVDIFNPEAMGTEARKLFGNSQKRALLGDAYARLDDTVAKWSQPSGRQEVIPAGGKVRSTVEAPNLNVSIRELAAFADALDKQFGSVAKTGFAGEIEGALGTALDAADVASGGKTGLFKNAMDAIRGRMKPKVSDLEGYITMEELLKRGRK